MSEARAITNFIGNGVAAIVISKWENELDLPRLKAELSTNKDLGFGDPRLDHGMRKF
jgi:aerobic C4-dicarboxylate transport protein